MRSAASDVWALLGTLPLPYRQALTLFYAEEKSYEEIAQLLDMPIGTVKTHIHRPQAAGRDVCLAQRDIAMTACPAFEDRLLDYRELAPLDRQAVDAHLASCAGCRGYLRTLEEVDAVFSGQLRGITLDPQLLAGIRDRIATNIPVGSVTKLPEWLDFAAACAVGVFGYTLLTDTGLLAYFISTLASPAN